MAARTKVRAKTGGSKSAPEGKRRSEVTALRAELEAAEAKKERAITRATKALREENEELEAHLTGAVREIGQLRFVVDRVAALERQLNEKAEDISALKAEIARLEEAVASGRPTALAAAAAAGTRRSRGLEVLIGRPRQASS